MVELAVASVFHPGSVRLEGWRSTVRRPHYDDEIQGVTVPASEEVVAPIELWILGLLAESLLQIANHEDSKGIHRIPHIVGHMRLRRLFPTHLEPRHNAADDAGLRYVA
jgi:hypothetical protein